MTSLCPLSSVTFSVSSKSRQNGLHKGLKAVDRAVVYVCEVGFASLDVIGNEPRRPFCHRFSTARDPNLVRRGDHDDGVEQRVGPRLVQQRDLDDCNVRFDAVEPGCVALAHPRVEQLLEPRELGRIAEDDLGDARAVGRGEALVERSFDLGVTGVELVDDVV